MMYNKTDIQSNMEDRLAQLKELMQVGHCTESKAAVHNTCNNTKKLFEVYLYYIRQCTQKDFPSLPFLRSQFGAEVAQWGGYIDAVGMVQAHKRNVFCGECNAQLEVGDYTITQCWLRHESKLEVWVKGHAHLHIDCFENSELVVHVEGKGARVYVNTYADSKAVFDGYTERVVATVYDCKTYKMK